jgi:hypothetical protein
MRHRTDGASLRKYCNNANGGVNQMLFNGSVHFVTGGLSAIFTYSKSPGLLSMPTFGSEIQLANLPGHFRLLAPRYSHDR